MLRGVAWMLLLCCVALPGRALVNGEAPAADDTRFDAVGAWGHTARLNPGRGHDAEHQWYGAAVLIAPDVVLTAKHLLPNGVDNLPRRGTMTVRFRRHTDGSIGSEEGGARSYHQAVIERFVLCPDSDLMLCILREPVEHIEPVQVDLSGDTHRETPVVLAGWGSTSVWRGNPGPRIELRVGENACRVGNGRATVLHYETEPREKPNGTMSAVITEERAVPNLYDSGGSIFIEDDEGNIRLVGIITTYSGGPWVGPYADNERFPLGAAVQGSDALLDALAEG